MLSPECLLPIPLPAFEGGFGFTPWETPAQFSPPTPHARVETPAPVQTPVATPHSSGSDGPGRDPPVSPTEERRIRRMISNRESARRSRMRKQRHLEDLRSQVERLNSENRELATRLVATTRHCLLFCRENDRLRSEAAALRRRLSDIRRVLIFRNLQRLVSAPPPVACGGGPGEPQALPPPVYGGGFMTETELIA